MMIENLDLEDSAEELRDFIEKAVAQKGTQNQPRFYAITGSHIYGDLSGHGQGSGDEVVAMLFGQQQQIHELLSQETRHHIIQTILGHPSYLPSITEFGYYISKSKPTIHEHLDHLQEEEIIRAYEIDQEERKRDLPYRFYGLTEYCVGVLYEYKYLRGGRSCVRSMM